MNKAYKYRIYPDEEQIILMSKTFGCCRLLYNSFLGWYNEAYKNFKENGIPIPKYPLVTFFKEQFPFMKEVDSLALMNSRANFIKALKNFFDFRKGKRKGKKVGFPKFKKKHKSKDAYTTNLLIVNNGHDTNIQLDEKANRIKLPKLGWVRMDYHRPISGIIKHVTVSRSKSGRYFVSITVETEREKPLVNKRANASHLKVCGNDLSMSKLIVSSEPEDDENIKYERNYRKEEKILKRRHRQFSKKQKGSKNQDKARLKLGRAYEKTANRRREFVIRVALYLTRKYDVIVLEDIDLQNMARTLHLGKSVNDLGFGQFRRWLEYFAKKYDCTIVYADKWFASSKTCSVCGYKKQDLELKDREWVCPKCGATHDRDRNAAINLRDLLFKEINTDGTSGIYACGDGTSTLREILEQVLSVSSGKLFVKQEKSSTL